MFHWEKTLVAMTSGHPYTPTEHWLRPGSERSAVGQKKIEELQQQLAYMQNDVNARNVLDQKLRRIQEFEQEKRNAEEKVLVSSLVWIN